jgi:hypothetical protein
MGIISPQDLTNSMQQRRNSEDRKDIQPFMELEDLFSDLIGGIDDCIRENFIFE